MDEPITSIGQLLNRFTQRRPFAASLTSQTTNFNPDTFVRRSQEHADQHNFASIHVATGLLFGGPSQQPAPVINNVATFDKNVFFQDPNDKSRIFSCCDEDMKTYFQTRGFVEVSVTHFTRMPEQQSTLPTVHVTESSRSSRADLQSVPAPGSLSLPAEYPTLWIPHRKTFAWSIIHAFEVKVYEADTDRSYSPYRLWTSDARKKFKTKSNSKWTKYCQAYFILRTFHGNTLGQCQLTMSQLAKLGAEYNATNPLPRGTDGWFNRAVGVLPTGLAASNTR